MDSVLLFASVSRVGENIRVPSGWKLKLFFSFSQGSYPTLIVILVCIQKSPVDYQSTYSTGMQFANPPSLDANRLSDKKPRQVYTIRREYVNDSDTQVPSAMFSSTLDDEKGL